MVALKKRFSKIIGIGNKHPTKKWFAKMTAGE
jgi:hypothetical protein